MRPKTNHPPNHDSLVTAVCDALPQTQCTRCGYADCQAYAHAMVHENIPINQCPPGGEEGIRRLADLTGQIPQPLNPQHGVEGALHVAIVDEAWCIGCTLCIKACPVDAIVGLHKFMHTVQRDVCTGCALCLPVCPVDCILWENVSGELTGWQAWTTERAADAQQRYAQHQKRQHPPTPSSLPSSTSTENTKELSKKELSKKEFLAAILAKSK